MIARIQTDVTLRGLMIKLAANDVKGEYIQLWRFVHARELR